MNEEQWQGLGRRAVACKAWRWMPGMLDGIDEQRVASVRDGLVTMESDGLIVIHANIHVARRSLPDLRDPATLGCLLALVREAWGEPRLSVYVEDCGSNAWRIDAPYDCSEKLLPLCQARYPSEAEALVEALEAAQ